jgi:hypothetical protein
MVVSQVVLFYHRGVFDMSIWLTLDSVVDGNVYGNCIVFPDADYDCGFDGSSSISGRRKFRCLTNRLGPTKRDLNGTAPISGQILATLP